MNKVIIIGRLTREPAISYTQGETVTTIAKYTLAVNRKYTRAGSGEQTADFINCVAFGKIAEFAEKYLYRGTKLVVEGRIQTGSYTNKDGNKVYTTDVIVEQCEFAESKNSGGDGNSSQAPRQESMNVDADGFMRIPDGVGDEGLPFN